MPDGTVRQTLAAYGEGNPAPYRMNRRGELLIPDWYHELSQEGRLFCVSNATQGTATAMGGTSYAATTPAILVDFPSGVTGIPLEVRLVQGGTVAGADITILVSYDNIVRFSSGGTGLSIRKLRTDGPVATQAVAYTGATAAAAGITPTLAYDIQAADVTIGTNVFEHREFLWSARNSVAVPYLVGPASFLVFTFAATTQPSWHFFVSWAELPSTTVV